ncbi:hypothetical protein H9645_04600 [Luteimonas sp. Sa2BVA3]|uniref:Phasin family protein n=1 Tax=Luteimonas colneyensis TaxID=2762230 RepID=A0ABR8UH01_9GAMM|nr:hypothetical protein [Luteimonas colneyensis]MBD7987302.1 hypothetical protein [Luteimonas colneyensis]
MSFASDLSTVANFISKMNSFNAVVESDRANESKAARGSWMVALATMLGKMADRLGDAIVDQAQKIDTEMNRQAGLREDGKEIKDSNLTQLNAEMTAMAQQMKMLQESISTIIKSIGEGNSSIARKQ